MFGSSSLYMDMCLEACNHERRSDDFTGHKPRSSRAPDTMRPLELLTTLLIAQANRRKARNRRLGLGLHAEGQMGDT